MPHDSPTSLLVLTSLRLASFAESERVAAVFGLPVDEVDQVLADLGERKLARHRDGRISGWMLTTEGRVEGERLLAVELDEHELRAELSAAYGSFLELNPRLLAVCSAWQLRVVDGQQVPNDHSDSSHDAEAVKELVELDKAAQPVCAELSRLFGRFAAYGPRLTHARERVEAGDGDWFAKPTIDSYHTVWFELHEHLLASLGIERGSEQTPDVAN